MIKVRSKPGKCYTEFDTVYSDWPKLNQVPIFKLYPNLPPFFYFSKDGKEFMYISPVYSFIIPKESKLTVSEILSDNIDFSNWTLKKIGDDIGNYTKNELLRSGTFIYNDQFSLIFDPIPHQNEEVNGTWKLLDSDNNIEIEFSLKISTTYWDNMRLDIGFPEKTKVPFDRNLIHRKELFILHILSKTWKNRQ